MSDDVYNATVIQRTDLNPDLIILRVKSNGLLFPFEAGQYTVLGRNLRLSANRHARGRGSNLEGTCRSHPDRV